MTILIAGASGYIGGHVTRALAALGHRCLCLVRDRRKAEDEWKEWTGIGFLEGDLGDPSKLLMKLDEPLDTLVNAAGLLGTLTTPPERLLAVNGAGPGNLFERAARFGIRHFIHLSAAGVTGPLGAEAADEGHPCRPATAYEKSKLAGEVTVQAVGRRLNIPYTILRPTFTYGPGDPHKLPLFRMVDRGLVVTCGRGSSVNHPLFISDLVHAVRLAVVAGGRDQTYIIGGERAVSKREFLEAIARALGRKTIRLPLPKLALYGLSLPLDALGRWLRFDPPLTGSRANMLCRNYGYRIDKAGRELGYRPRTALPQGIAETVSDYRRRGWL